MNPSKLFQMTALSSAIVLAGCGGNDRGTANSGTPTATLGTVTTSFVPTGQLISPTAAPGSTFSALNPGLKDLPNFTAGQAVSQALSPDRKTLLVLTSGYNNNLDAQGKLIPAQSNEYVFVFDVSGSTAVQKQVLQVPNTYLGIAFAPTGNEFYVSGGGDDNLHVFSMNAGAWAESGSAIPLKHATTNGLRVSPLATGVAVTADSSRAIVTNRYNDSITIVDLVKRTVAAELDLRPGKSGGQSGVPGGEYPNWVQIVGNRTAYVSSERDREVVVVDISGGTPRVTGRISVKGNPNKMALNQAQTTLYVASDNADVVSIIDVASNTVTSTVQTVAPNGLMNAGDMKYRGASPNGLTLSPDESTLYVTNRGTNSLAVIALNQPNSPVVGLIPTGYNPSDVAVNQAGNTLYIINAKSVTGPNPGNCYGYGEAPCPAKNSPVKQVQNQYVEQITKAGFATVPVPGSEVLALLTKQVATNNNFSNPASSKDAATVMALRSSIKHVIYIIKENRTYDQVLGDLGKGNSDPTLAEFPKAITPNQHKLASSFVALDNFYDSGDVSGDGWPWSTSARESDAGSKMLPMNYGSSPLTSSSRGGTYDWEGANRNINMGLTGAERQAANPLTPPDPDLLPGTGNVAAPDGPNGETQEGYLWNSALRAGLSVRNYGMMIDLSRYSLPVASGGIALERAPAANNVVQAYSSNKDLAALTDPYFRGYDGKYPDFYREQEWEREFNGFVTNGKLPALSLVRFMNDHTGSFGSAIDGVNTPEAQIADNDYAVGKLVQAVANSPYAKDTLIFVVEDDAQDGPDHVDAHRSTAYVVGPYVKTGELVSTRYTTVNMIRTITDILGTDHLGIYDATQGPMTDVFDLAKTTWSYAASPSTVLSTTKLPIQQNAFAGLAKVKPTHDATYWVAMTKGMDFSSEDKVSAGAYNRVLWKGLMGRQPYPAKRSGIDLRVGQVSIPVQVAVVKSDRASSLD